MNEDYKYKTIKKLVDTDGNKKAAALKLSCSTRTINRLIQVYKTDGKSGFVHGNRNRKPSTTIDDSIKQTVIDLFRTIYYDANLIHFQELLQKHHDISVSRNTISKWLYEFDLISIKAHRKTKRLLTKKLKMKQKKSTSTKVIREYDQKIEEINRYDAHPRRPRCAYFGELVQMDASPHKWFANEITHLHLAIDDATGKIIGGYFDTQETLHAYYQVYYQILTSYGIPAKFLTDRRTVFEYKRKNAPHDYEDTLTQFAYAAHQLGTELETSSIPQAKGRVERLNQTLQSRLVVELRLAGVSTIEDANLFLNSYIKEYHKQFSLPIHHTKTVFEKQPKDEKIHQILSVLSFRKLDSGHCIRYKNKYYLPKKKSGDDVYLKRGMNALVIETFNQKLYVNILDQIFALEEVVVRHDTSSNFDFTDLKPKRTYHIPAPDHPWRQFTYSSFVSKQKQRSDGANV